MEETKQDKWTDLMAKIFEHDRGDDDLQVKDPEQDRHYSDMSLKEITIRMQASEKIDRMMQENMKKSSKIEQSKVLPDSPTIKRKLIADLQS